MSGYIANRLLLALLTVVGVTAATFLVVRFIPGDIVDQIVATSIATPEGKQELRKQFGLTQSLPKQYVKWVSGIGRGDFGKEFVSGRPIGSELTHRLPRTAELGTIALLVGVTISIPIGVVAAVRQDSPVDMASRATAVLLLSTPGFWLATLVVVLPSKFLSWAPPPIYAEVWRNTGENLKLIMPPALILGVGLTGTLMRLTRTQLLEVLRQDYIRTAWSKGLRERTVISRHALRNSLIPIVTVVGLQLPLLVSGTVVMESIFNIPGIGSYFLSAVSLRDYPAVEAVNLIVAVVVVLSNLAVDIVYSWLDPRVRYSS